MPSSIDTTFCLDLLKQLGDIDKTANVFVSSLSITSVLNMALLGAKGNTAKQISECLKTQHCQEKVHADFNQRLNALKKPDAPYAFNVANKLYGEQSSEFVTAFFEIIKKYFRGEMETVDFKNRDESTRFNINSWVEKHSQGKIKDLLEECAVDSYTLLVLVNAIYCQSSWKYLFDEDATKDAQFRLDKTFTTPVKMMNQYNKFKLTNVHQHNFKILELPYKEGELSMLIFLPMDIDDSSTGLEQLEKELTYENFMVWTNANCIARDVQVGLPKFKIEEKYDMESVLVIMGMVDAFDAKKSDFSGLSSDCEVIMSRFIHQPLVHVKEDGSEIEVATDASLGVGPAQKRANPSAKKGAITGAKKCECSGDTFIADHPFLFFIRHNPTNSVLFAGRYCSPE